MQRERERNRLIIHHDAKKGKYVNQELPDFQAGFRKDRGTRDQIANICWIIEKQENSRKQNKTTKTSTSSLTMLKPLTVGHNKLENSERDGNTRLAS